MRDIGPLVLSLAAMTVATLVFGLWLVPDWAPEVLPVAGVGAIVLSIVSQVLALRNALAGRQLAWCVVIALAGPLGTMAYSLISASRSGAMTAVLDDLAKQTVGEEPK
jgi:hypothetical protein